VVVSERDARFQGYREGRAAVWREVLDWAAENLATAEQVLGHAVVTADDVRGVLKDDSPAPIGLDVERLRKAMAYRRFEHGDGDHTLVPPTPEYVAAAYERLTLEDVSPLGHGTPVPEEATLPSGDARVAGL
jgi:hypothetical protein